jgi:hypothetical protein
VLYEYRTDLVVIDNEENRYHLQVLDLAIKTSYVSRNVYLILVIDLKAPFDGTQNVWK